MQNVCKHLRVTNLVVRTGGRRTQRSGNWRRCSTACAIDLKVRHSVRLRAGKNGAVGTRAPPTPRLHTSHTIRLSQRVRVGRHVMVTRRSSGRWVITTRLLNIIYSCRSLTLDKDLCQPVKYRNILLLRRMEIDSKLVYTNTTLNAVCQCRDHQLSRE